MKSKTEQIEELKRDLETQIEVKITSSRGHDTLMLNPTEAVSRIQDECETRKKWLYMDGLSKNPMNITTEDVLEADDITLTNGLAGGSSTN